MTDKGKPEPGKQYRLTGADVPSIANGNTWAESEVPASWMSEVTTAGDNGRWSSNGLRFATKAEADAYGLDLAMRWTAVADIRSVESTDPVTDTWPR